GNDALDHSGVFLHESATSFAEVVSRLAEIHEQFHQDYRQMLQRVLSLGKATAVCTVYDSIPGLDRIDKTGLCLFNDVILREAVRSGVPVIDLRLICNEVTDYSPSSPIEPSVAGGGKIARAIIRVVSGHDFQAPGSRAFI